MQGMPHCLSSRQFYEQSLSNLNLVILQQLTPQLANPLCADQAKCAEHLNSAVFLSKTCVHCNKQCHCCCANAQHHLFLP